MLDNGLEPVSGHLWFVNKVVNDGTAIMLTDEDDDDTIFRLAVEELRVGSRPTVLLETRTPEPEARYYPYGLNKTEDCRIVCLHYDDISIEEVFALIDRLHEQYLCTPDVQGRAGRLWSDSARRIPASDAEDKISIVVRNGLTGQFPACLVRAEQVQATGRLDIIIVEPISADRSVVKHHAILELKVLRSRNSGNRNIPVQRMHDWVEDGVKQVAEYRADKGAAAAALCCFDMRDLPSEQDCFDHVRVLAGQLRVRLRCWHLFASSAAYRAYRVDVAISGTSE
jgi:hypothetical protein